MTLDRLQVLFERGSHSNIKQVDVGSFYLSLKLWHPCFYPMAEGFTPGSSMGEVPSFLVEIWEEKFLTDLCNKLGKIILVDPSYKYGVNKSVA
jgi:hypothetical protein